MTPGCQRRLINAMPGGVAQFGDHALRASTAISVRPLRRRSFSASSQRDLGPVAVVGQQGSSASDVSRGRVCSGAGPA
jgi:hypothetical protein